MLQATLLKTGLWKIVDPKPSSLTPVKMCAAEEALTSGSLATNML